MSQLIVVIFDDVNTASEVRQRVHDAQNTGRVKLNDAAVVYRDEDGKVHTKSEADKGIIVGSIGGGLLGLLIAGVFFPIAGVVIGALGGALVGKLAGIGIDDKFVKQVSESLEPGKSAVFLLVTDDSDPDFLAATLRPFQGEVYQTTLSQENEETLRRTLHDTSQSDQA